MRPTYYQTKGQSTPLESKSSILMIAAVLVLLAVAVSTVELLAAGPAMDGAPSVQNPSAWNAQNSWIYPRPEPGFACASSATGNWPVSECWSKSAACFYYHLSKSTASIMSKKTTHLPPLIRDVLYGLEMGVFDNDLGQALVEIWSAGVADQRIVDMIRYRVFKERCSQAFSRMPFRLPHLTQGKLVLGFDLDGRPIVVQVQYLNDHILVISGSGGGKTNRIRFAALQIAPRLPGMWLFDLRKREFRALRPYLARLSINLVILPARQMRINPLQVPLGVEPVDWAPRVADMLVQVLGLPPRASKLLQTCLFGLYHQFGVFDGQNTYPTLFDLRQTVDNNQKLNAQARHAIVDSLDPVLWSLGPKVLAYRYGWPVDKLAQMHLAIEFAGLAEVDKDLLLNTLVLSEFASRIARGISNPDMDLWICCDEAARLCSASRSASGHISAVGDLIGLVRGTGIGLDLSVLSASDLAPQVPSNTATKVLGRCGSATDYTAAGHSMGLTSDQIHWAQLHLKPGMFIGQVGEGDWRHPFVFRVPLLNLTSGAKSAQTSSGLGPLNQLPVIPA